MRLFPFPGRPFMGFFAFSLVLGGGFLALSLVLGGGFLALPYVALRPLSICFHTGPQCSDLSALSYVSIGRSMGTPIGSAPSDFSPIICRSVQGGQIPCFPTSHRMTSSSGSQRVRRCFGRWTVGRPGRSHCLFGVPAMGHAAAAGHDPIASGYVDHHI